MTRRNRPVGEDDLTAYVDGELTPERRALVEEWLESHPEERRRIKADIEIGAMLREGLEPLVNASLPERFRVDDMQARLRAGHLSRLSRIAALLALMAASGAGGWFLRGSAGGGMDDSAVALAAHRVFVPDAVRPVEIGADASDQLGTWLGKRIGLQVTVPDLSGSGLRLIGGRLVPGRDGVPAGLLMYETASGQRVTLYFRAARGDGTSIVFSETGEGNTLKWQFADMTYVLTGPADRDRMVEIAQKVNASAS